MQMDTLVVLFIVATSAAFIGRRVWRAIAAARAPKGGCTDCGCGKG